MWFASAAFATAQTALNPKLGEARTVAGERIAKIFYKVLTYQDTTQPVCICRPGFPSHRERLNMALAFLPQRRKRWFMASHARNSQCAHAKYIPGSVSPHLARSVQRKANKSYRIHLENWAKHSTLPISQRWLTG